MRQKRKSWLWDKKTNCETLSDNYEIIVEIMTVSPNRDKNVKLWQNNYDIRSHNYEIKSYNYDILSHN